MENAPYRFFFGDYYSPLALLILLAGALLLAGYYFLVVYLKTPQIQVEETAQKTPPDDLSAGAISFIRNKAYSTETFTAAIFATLEKGAFDLRKNRNGTYSAVRAKSSAEQLSADEKAAFTHNDRGKFWRTVNFSKSGKQLEKMNSRCATALDQQFGDHFNYLKIFKYIGIGLSFLFLLATTFAFERGEMTQSMALYVIVAAPIAIFTGWAFKQGIQSSNRLVLLFPILGVLIALGCVVAMAAAWGLFSALIPILFGLINFIAWEKVAVYSAEGLRLAHQIEQFEKFMKSRPSSKQTADLFQEVDYRKKVAYRIALGLEGELVKNWQREMRGGNQASAMRWGRLFEKALRW